uniref:Uncharacterized protein n=1 Tax=Ditylenchus dipsaci TaxID=166011 RepID=A0A915ERB9_9BILA
MDHLLSLLEPANLKNRVAKSKFVTCQRLCQIPICLLLNLPDTNLFGAATSNLPQNVVPNLFVWLDMAENAEFNPESASDSRSKLASLLPHEYTLAQPYNYYSQLILRHLLDQNHSLELVENHCYHCLVDGLLNAIDSFGGDDSSQELSSRIRTIVKVVVQIDVVFNTDLLAGLMQQAVEMMKEELDQLLRHHVDPLIQLEQNFPLPPSAYHLSIYLQPSSPLDRQNNCLAKLSKSHLKPELVHFMESEANDHQDATSQQYNISLIKLWWLC